MTKTGLDVARLRELEGMLADDVVDDKELVAELRALGLPELARTMDRALRAASVR